MHPAHLWRVVLCIVFSHHSPCFICLSRCCLCQPLRIFEQVNFGANFKVFDKIIKKILVVFSFAVFGLDTA